MQSKTSHPTTRRHAHISEEGSFKPIQWRFHRNGRRIFVGVTSPDNNVTLLPMVLMRVSGTNGTVVGTYGLLDQGSEVTFIDSKLAEKLGLEGKT